MNEIKFVIGLILVFSDGHLLAQHTSLVVQAAPTVSWIPKKSPPDFFGPSPKVNSGFSIAPILKHHVNERFRVCYGIELERYSTKYVYDYNLGQGSFPNNIVEEVATFKATYLSIPVFIEYCTGNKLKTIFQIGQSFSILTKSSTDYSTYYHNDDFEYKISKTNHSAFIGVGIELAISESVSLCYGDIFKLGISDINLDNDDTPIRTRALVVYLGIKYKLLKKLK